MTPMPFNPAPPRRAGQPKRRAAASAPVPPTLVAATCDPQVSVTLTFDRAVDLAAFDGYAVLVWDPLGEGVFQGDSPGEPVGANGVRVPLHFVENYGGTAQTMTVGMDNGIVAVDGGEAWAGVEQLALPFGIEG